VAIGDETEGREASATRVVFLESALADRDAKLAEQHAKLTEQEAKLAALTKQVAEYAYGKAR